MTLRVKIELIPFGNEDKAETLEVFNISNLGKDPSSDSYNYMIEHNEYKAFSDKAIPVIHDRKDGAIVLANKALNAYLNRLS